MFQSRTKPNQLKFQLASCSDDVHEAVERAKDFFYRHDLRDYYRCTITLRELLRNAVAHGNHFDDEKRVRGSVRAVGDGLFRITVGDEGRGFDPSEINDFIPDHPGRRARNFGYPLIKAMAREVRFFDHGRIVSVTLRGRENGERNHGDERND